MGQSDVDNANGTLYMMALRGIKVVELAGLAPGPFCGMVLADFGASVIRVDRLGSIADIDCLANGKQSISLNLKHEKAIEIFRRLCKQSDVMIEPFRAGVMEKLGLGPDVLHKDNKRLIYARLSGFGQTGPYKNKAGHDINYVAMSGILSMLGWGKDKMPKPPANLLADFAGGGMTCALGILMALFEREKSGIGQVVDCSMVDGTAYLGSWVIRGQHMPIWGDEPMLCGAASFYNNYETKDGKYMAVGALEPQFYSQFLKGLGLTEEEVPQFGEAVDNKKLIASIFKQKTRDEWCKIFAGLDACVTPVLTINEAAEHEHNVVSGTYGHDSNGKIFPKPAPVLSRTPAQSNACKSAPSFGQHTEQILTDIGYAKHEIQKFEDLGAIMTNKL